MAIFTSGIESKIRQQVIPYLSPPVKSMLSSLPGESLRGLEEIRLRVGRPLLLKIGDTDYGVAENGVLLRNYEKGYVVGEEDLQRTMAAISESSLYALEEELKRGFITLRGGHRVGLAGRVVLARGDIKTMRDFGGLAFRIAREVVGCGTSLLGRLWRGNGQLLNTLIISPPRCGKTTLLRDLTRQLASGSGGINVALVDERSEIAACYRGVPQLDVGIRTDVLDGCPKASGMIMAIRALSPQLVVTDEVGRPADVEAIRECINAGVAIITSVHGRDLEEIGRRPELAEIVNSGAFSLVVTLSRRRGPGTIETVQRMKEVKGKVKDAG
ncbi:MAG: stage III sporulation protein AA [Syntrophomonadaceae bacterium]|jgi:stage III sporulation protein AA|nr:stage III sporulation protein AA [Syntrophomonadaceae bacterium]